MLTSHLPSLHNCSPPRQRSARTKCFNWHQCPISRNSSVFKGTLTLMIDDPSTCQLPYHSQATHYLITARSHIPALGEACEIQASDPSRLTFQSGQSMSTSQLSYYIQVTHSTLQQTICESPDQSPITLSRPDIPVRTDHVHLSIILSSMSTNQLCYHSQATHSTLEQTICESPSQSPITLSRHDIPVRTVHANLPVILSERVECRLVTQSGAHSKPGHSQGLGHTFHQ